MKHLHAWLRRTYERVNRLSGGSLGIVRDAVLSFGRERAPEAAAGMAYYTFFSLFPLVLLLIAVAGLFLRPESAYDEVVRAIQRVIPVPQEDIVRNLDAVRENPGPSGLVGLAGTLWSASGALKILAANINRAFPGTRARTAWGKQVVALIIIAALLMILLLWLASTAVARLLPELSPALWPGFARLTKPYVRVAAEVLPWVLSFLMFLGLYRWVPNTRIRWGTALIVAALAATAWQGASLAFAWYIRSGLAGYEAVYGSLGAVASLMVWIYLSSTIVLFGAHLGGALTQHRNRREVAERQPGRKAPPEELVGIEEGAASGRG